VSKLLIKFNSLTASRKNRDEMLNYVLNNPKEIETLFRLAFDYKSNRENIYATWVWELFTLNNLENFSQYFFRSLSLIPLIKNSSMRRSLSKCFWHFLKVKKNYNILDEKQKHVIVNTFLEWIITEKKTAPLNFSIRILLLFKKDLKEVNKYLNDVLNNPKKTFPRGLYPTLRLVFKS